MADDEALEKLVERVIEELDDTKQLLQALKRCEAAVIARAALLSEISRDIRALYNARITPQPVEKIGG